MVKETLEMLQPILVIMRLHRKLHWDCMYHLHGHVTLTDPYTIDSTPKLLCEQSPLLQMPK